jgi:hypothetical protein
MIGVLFLGRLDPHAEAAIDAARASLPAVEWTVVVAPQDAADALRRSAARDSLADKPTGSRLAALRSLRARRFDVAVLLWGGRPGEARLSMQGLLCGARRYRVFLPDAGLLPLHAGDRRIWSSLWRGLRRGPCAPDLVAAGFLWWWDRTIGRLWTRRAVRRAAQRVRARLRASDPATAAAAPAHPEALPASKPRG